jgi:hypothetical protein
MIRADRWLVGALTCAFFLGIGVEFGIFEIAKKMGKFGSAFLLMLLGIGAYILAYLLVEAMP